ncbi:MAG: agmatinase family protein [Bacteroidetes bacterium]|nr:agmatinase family protein [Bacteroidota bacterium]
MSHTDFNPNNPGTADSNVFGLPYSMDEAQLILLPVPWEATVSYGAGTVKGPEAIFEASKQIDLFHPLVKEVWKKKIAMDEISTKMGKLSTESRKKVKKIIAQITAGKKIDKQLQKEVNEACSNMVDEVESRAEKLLNKGKAVAGLGGDHSTPLGLLRALSKKKKFGILHIDAHCDLRKAYEGFDFSHASIMYNAMQLKNIQSLTQVGIRDYCEEEVEYINSSKERVKVFFDRENQAHKLKGGNWDEICKKIIATLPENVFISFDIDGLTPDLCPHTGTPVPGGLSFAEASYLLEQVALKRNIISFDLNEVSPREDEWDANVGARMLFQLCCAYFISEKG